MSFHDLPIITNVKHQSSIVRFSLRNFSNSHLPTCTNFQEIWVKCIGNFHSWQDFIRKIKGYSDDRSEIVLANKDNFYAIVNRLQAELPNYGIAQLKWAVASSFVNKQKVHTSLIEQAIMRKSIRDLNMLEEHVELGFLEPSSDNVAIISQHLFTPTELGKYAAGISLEITQKRPLSHVQLARLGLSSTLCRLETISSSVTISWGYEA